MKLVEHTPAPRRNVLIYGPPKTAKTTAACSAPSPLLLNADLPNATWFARERHPEVAELDYEGFGSLTEIQERVKTKGPYETVIVDPVGELYRRLLEEFSRMAISPTLPTYQAVSVHLERFCRALCLSPHVNAVFICHEHPTKNEATGSVENLPWTGTQNPSLGMKLMSMVDVVAFAGVLEHEESEPEYVAQLINAKGRRGGDRSGSLGVMRTLDVGEWLSTMAAALPQPQDHTNHRGAKPQKEPVK